MKYLISLIIPIVLLLQTGCKQTNHQEKEETKLIVSNPVLKDTIIYRDYVSQIRSIRHIELRALEKGYLQDIYVDEGQLVKKGQLLFQIIPTVYKAEANKAAAELQFAEIEYKNTKSLSDSNVVSKNELALAKAKMDKARSDYELALAHLGFTEIHAPFDGIIGRFNDVRIGSLLDEGELLTTISDNTKMWVYFNVPEAEYLNYMNVNAENKTQKVKLKMANDQMFAEEGTIETIEADFNNETGNIAFRAIFNNYDHILRHGETGNILMPVPLKQALLIPQQATFEVLNKKYVYIVKQDGVVEAREIQVQQEMPHIYVVASGLTVNDAILIEGLRKVKNGDKIQAEKKSFYTILSGLNHLKAE